MAPFGFMELDIGKEVVTLNAQLSDLADALSDSRSYRVAEQLQGASLSISNHIAEGSGSFSPKDFANFLNIAGRSDFEPANSRLVAYSRKFTKKEKLDQVLNDLGLLSKKITNFKKSILS